MKKIAVIIAIVLIFFVVFSFGKNMFVKVSISAGIGAVTGLKLDIEDMDVGILKTLIGIKGLRLFNPPGFADKLMVDMPEIYVDYDLGAFFKRRVHIEELRLNLEEFVVVKNEKGELNIDSLKKTIPQIRKEKGQRPDFKIDVMELKIGRVIYKDYSKGLPPSVREFNVNINERYENITNIHSLANLILVRALMNTTIANLSNFDLGPLLKGTTKIAEEAAGRALGLGKDIGVMTKETAEKTVDKVVEKATDTLEKILPFGK